MSFKDSLYNACLEAIFIYRYKIIGGL